MRKSARILKEMRAFVRERGLEAMAGWSEVRKSTGTRRMRIQLGHFRRDTDMESLIRAAHERGWRIQIGSVDPMRRPVYLTAEMPESENS